MVSSKASRNLKKRTPEEDRRNHLRHSENYSAALSQKTTARGPTRRWRAISCRGIKRQCHFHWFSFEPGRALFDEKAWEKRNIFFGHRC